MNRASRAALIGLLLTSCNRANPPSEASPPASVGGSGACTPWDGRGFSLKSHSQAGRADFFSTFTYDDGTGTLSVVDSDPFAEGAESSKPRVIQRSRVLGQADRDSLARDLFGVCPDAKALTAPEEPTTGGVRTLEVRSSSGVVKNVYDAKLSIVVHTRLKSFFPELRK